MGEHPIGQQIVDIICQHDYWYEAFEHQPIRTSQEAADANKDYSNKQGAKSLIVWVKPLGGEKKLIMLVFPGDKKFDRKKIKTLLNTKDVRFAAEAEVETVTLGVKLGGVPPFGNLFDLQVIADKSLFNNEKIIFNAGRDYSIAMKSEDYKQLVSPLVASIV